MATKKRSLSKSKPAKRQQSIIPYLLYNDVAAALAWLNTFYGDRRYGAEDPEGHQWYFA